MCGQEAEEDTIIRHGGVSFTIAACKDHLQAVDHITDVLSVGLILQRRSEPDCWVCMYNRDTGVSCSLHESSK